MFFPPELERWLLAMGVGLTRTLPIVWMIPAFGGKNVPAQVRMGLALALSAVSFPQVLLSLPRTGGPMFWILLLAREGLVGFTVGFVGASIFRAAESAGKLIDILRGANMAEVLSPVAEERSSPLGDIFTLLVSVIFLELGGLPLVAAAMARSYEAVPLDFTPMPASLAGAANLVIITSAKLLEATLALAAPALVALLLADLVLGAVARMAPQIPVYFVGMPLKALAGVGIVLVGIGGLQSALYGSFDGWLRLVERAFGTWR
jgi:type III secretion protein SpaR/YscT/HrcT